VSLRQNERQEVLVTKVIAELVSVESQSTDIRIYSFDISDYNISQFPVGKHVFFHLESPDGVIVKKPYTPISYKSGMLKFIIRIYPDGMASKILCKLKSNDYLRISLPHGHFKTKKINANDVILLISAGTGIAPILSVLKWLYRIKCSNAVRLLNWHSRADEHLLEPDLRSLSNDMTDMKFVYIHSKTMGRISKEILDDVLSSDFVDNVTYCAYCGSNGFNASVKTILDEIGIGIVFHQFGPTG